MADVLSNLYAWSATAGSNLPDGSTTIGTGLDDNLRQIQATVRQWLAAKGADIASGSTTDLGAIPGLFHDITGTTTITGFGTVDAGIWKVLKFEGVLTLTHNATSLILPGAANITTAVGDMLMATSEGSGNWRVNWYSTITGIFLPIYVATVGGTADVITLTPSPARPAYAAGQTFSWIASGANTTNVTVNVSGLGAKALTKNGATALVAGDIQSGAIVTATYDGTRFQVSGITSSVTLPTITVLTSGTAATYTTPAGAKHLKVRGVGPGGGGGGCATAGAAAAAGEGGGSGAYFEKLITTLSATYTYTIGAGGAGGTAGNNAGSDGTAATTFTDGSLTLSGAAGKGGSGSGAAASFLLTGALATGGVAASGGDVNIPGTAGGFGFVGSASQANGGFGGGSQLGASVRNAVNSSATGPAGANYGSGGAGGQDINNTSTRAGGAGSPGIIIVEEFYN